MLSVEEAEQFGVGEIEGDVIVALLWNYLSCNSAQWSAGTILCKFYNATFHFKPNFLIVG